MISSPCPQEVDSITLWVIHVWTVMRIQRGIIREMKSSIGVQLGKFTFAQRRMLVWAARLAEIEKGSIWHEYRGLSVKSAYRSFSGRV